MMPVDEGNLEKVLNGLAGNVRQEGEPFCMLGVCLCMREDLGAIMPGQFRFTVDRGYTDYIYLRNDLATLKGERFQSKWNHISRFHNTYPDYECTPITKDRIQKCLELETKWYKANDCDQQEGTEDERRVLLYALNHFEELGLAGGILHVNGQIVAFIFDMPINKETFGAHVEEADTNINRTCAMINYEFANHIPEQYIYINREEDLGIKGLRKAKFSYYPETILGKYMTYLKEQPVEMIKW